MVPFLNMFEGIHPGVDLDEMKLPENCFEAFLSPRIVQHVCDWTNERAGRYLIENGTLKVYGVIWKDVTIAEMYTFFSLHLYMGIVHYPEVRDYWRRDFLFSGPNVFSAEIMSRNRFFGILKFLRFSDPKAFVPGRPITRLAMFFSYVRDNCMNIIDPGETVAIDECLVLYKGRLHFKQFIKSKRARFGIKMFCMCPSHPSLRGYTFNFTMYFGKDIYNTDHIPGSEHLTISERIVVILFQQFLEQGREIILDNWYMSLRLAEFLLTKNTYVTGTIRPGRGVPKELKEISLDPSQTCFIRKDDVLILRYKDKRDVFLLTSKHTAGFIERERYQPSVSSVVMYQKPSPIQYYNVNMGSVDAVDQDIEPYDCTRKSYSWFKKIGLHVIQRMVLNAKVLYQHSKINDISVLAFTKLLIGGLLTKYSPGFRKLKKKYEEENKNGKEKYREKHFFVSTVKENGSRRKRGTCRVCYQHGKKRTYTANLCVICPNAPIYLCSKPHFDEYHGYNQH